MLTPGLKTDRFPGTCRVLQNRDSTALSAHHHGEMILLTSTLLTNPGFHWTFLEVARGNFSSFLGFIILQVMVCSKEQSSLIPQYKRHLHRHPHRSQLSHKSLDLRLRRAASVGKLETRLSWSSYGPIISTAWKARTVGKLGMKLLEL